MGYETYYVNVTNSRTSYTGFNDVTIARPKFIYFQATGLRPNTRHFVFFDKTNVTNYVNTSAGTINDFNNLSRGDPKRNPGEKYINETGFPTDLGGPTSQIFSDAEGKIDGVFYLQSNSTINFPTGKRTLTVLDISVYNIDASGSYCSGYFTIDGGIENYSVSYYTSQEARTRYVPDPPPDPDPPVDPGPTDNTVVVDPDPEPEVDPTNVDTSIGVKATSNEPKYMITGNERYQNINGMGTIFKTNPITGIPEVIIKSETLGEILGEEMIGYGTGRIASNGANLAVGDAIVKAGFGGLKGYSTTNVLVTETNGEAYAGVGPDAAFKLVYTGNDNKFDHDWIDQFSGEDRFVGESATANPYFK